jgi:hypothetical protein
MLTWTMRRILVSTSGFLCLSIQWEWLHKGWLRHFVATRTASVLIGRSGTTVLTGYQVRNTRRSWPTNCTFFSF